jgi:ABC-type antimicrobial peptide transport system ATPase subunit
MKKLIKILHIDPNWKVIYILIRVVALVKTAVSLETALKLLAKQKFDLIFSEPQNIAILDPQATIDQDTMRRLPFWHKKGKNP